jgi:hypothetical protein
MLGAAGGADMPKSINLELRVWYDEKSRYIKLAVKGLTASTLSNGPASKRYHRNLFRKLAAALREGGATGPKCRRYGTILKAVHLRR